MSNGSAQQQQTPLPAMEVVYIMSIEHSLLKLDDNQPIFSLKENLPFTLLVYLRTVLIRVAKKKLF